MKYHLYAGTLQFIQCTKLALHYEDLDLHMVSWHEGIDYMCEYRRLISSNLSC